MSVGVVFKISYSRNEPMKLNLSSHIYDLYTVLADVAARRVGAQGLASSPAAQSQRRLWQLMDSWLVLKNGLR
jgi:hypothetical protein